MRLAEHGLQSGHRLGREWMLLTLHLGTQAASALADVAARAGPDGDLHSSNIHVTSINSSCNGLPLCLPVVGNGICSGEQLLGPDKGTHASHTLGAIDAGCRRLALSKAGANLCASASTPAVELGRGKAAGDVSGTVGVCNAGVCSDFGDVGVYSSCAHHKPGAGLAESTGEDWCQ